MLDTDFTQATFYRWCGACSAEQATDTINIEFDDQWVPLDIGPNCLAKLGDRIEK